MHEHYDLISKFVQIKLKGCDCHKVLFEYYELVC